MSRIALLFGEQALVAEYNERVAEKLAVKGMSEGKSSTIGLSRGIQQLLHDITNYDPYDCCFGISATVGAVFNAKKDFYRFISLVLSNLGLIFNIRLPSPWQVISELHTQEIIGESELANMKVCLSIANEIRLKTYFANEGQMEVLSPVPKYAKRAEQFSNNSHTKQYINDFPFYPDFDEDVVVRLLSNSFQIKTRCQKFCERYSKNTEIDIGILQNSPFHVSKAGLRGQLYFRLQNFPKALESLKSISEDSADYPSSLYGQGVIYIRCEEYEKGVEYLKKALGAHFKNEKMSSFSVLTGMRSLAQALILSEKGEEAKLRLEEAIRKHDEIYGQGSQTIELYLLMVSLGSVYAQLGDSALVLETYQKAEKMQHSLTDVPDSELIRINFEKGLSLAELNQNSESLECVKKALYYSHKLFGKDNLSIDLALSYMGAGAVYQRCLLFDEAVSWYERSLELFPLVFGGNPGVGKIFCLRQLGNLYLQRLEIDKAVESLQNALEGARTFYHDKPATLHALVLISLGGAMQRANKFHDSLQYFKEAKEIADKIPIFNRTNSFVPRIVSHIGNVYDKLGNLPKALQYFKDAFSLYSVIVKQDEDINKNMAMVCRDIARVSLKMGDFMRLHAKDYLTKAAVIYRKFPLTKPICSFAVSNLIRLNLVCEDIGETGEALKHLEEARNVAKAIEFKHVLVLVVLHRLSKKYNNEMRSFVKFRICFEEAIEMANCIPLNYYSMPPSLLEVIDVLKPR